MKSLIIIPTYNERNNIKALIPQIFSIIPDIWITVVDDNSPDGTADEVRNIMRKYDHLNLILREKREGLGKAYMSAFKSTLEDKDIKSIIMMDADFSHDPRSIPEMIRQSDNFTFVVGSRYIKGGGIVGWEIWRRALSLFGNIYCRIIIRIPIKDCTGGFNMINTNLLRRLDFEAMDSSGYAFQVELKYMLYKVGGNFKEIPIIFKNRTEGESKISSHIIREGILAPWKMVWRR
ncbi:MAG TPA: polyprenol monophosphomannose synthase [Candidatus Paceibacterota bacterium]